jgi:hypothetical protein
MKRNNITRPPITTPIKVVVDENIAAVPFAFVMLSEGTVGTDVGAVLDKPDDPLPKLGTEKLIRLQRLHVF